MIFGCVVGACILVLKMFYLLSPVRVYLFFVMCRCVFVFGVFSDSCDYWILAL